MNLKNKQTKKALVTGTSYSIAILAIYLLNNASPGGPCTPGLGILAFMLLIPVYVVVLFVSLYKSIRFDKSNFASTIIHLVACITILFGYVFHNT